MWSELYYVGFLRPELLCYFAIVVSLIAGLDSIGLLKERLTAYTEESTQQVVAWTLRRELSNHTVHSSPNSGMRYSFAKFQSYWIMQPTRPT